MPILDGIPSDDDVNNASRMVRTVHMIPGHPYPWIRPSNREGYWTIDASGRFAPFPGIAPVNVFDLDYVTEAATARMVGVSGGSVLVKDGNDPSFRVLKRFRSDTPVTTVSVHRLERANLTLVGYEDALYRLDGEQLTPWTETETLKRYGISLLWKTFDLPNSKAVLFTDGAAGWAVRFDDGRWVRPNIALADKDQVNLIIEAPRSDAVLISTRLREILMRVSPQDGSAGVLFDRDRSQPQETREKVDGEIAFSSATGDILWLLPGFRSGRQEWHRFATSGFQPIEGGAFAATPDKYLSLLQTQIPSRRETWLWVSEGYVVYNGERMHLVPGTGADTLGRQDLVDASVIDRVLVNSDRGLFEVSDNRTLKPRAWPFATGGLPKPLLAAAPSTNLMLVLARDGVFSMDEAGSVERIPGGEGLSVSFGASFTHEIPLSGDIILIANNRLYLVVNRNSERWQNCRAAVSST